MPQLEQYRFKVRDGDTIYWHLPRKVQLPEESSKYVTVLWDAEAYSWFRLANWAYGTPDLYWLVLAMNDLVDPYSVQRGDLIRLLLPEFLNEVIIQ